MELSLPEGKILQPASSHYRRRCRMAITVIAAQLVTAIWEILFCRPYREQESGSRVNEHQAQLYAIVLDRVEKDKKCLKVVISFNTDTILKL